MEVSRSAALRRSFPSFTHTHLYPRLSSFLHLPCSTSYHIGLFFSLFLVCMAYNVRRPRSSVTIRVICFSGATRRKKKNGCLISTLTITPETHVGKRFSRRQEMNERLLAHTAATLQFLKRSAFGPAVWWITEGAKILWLIPPLERLRKAMTRFSSRFPFFFFFPRPRPFWCGAGRFAWWRLNLGEPGRRDGRQEKNVDLRFIQQDIARGAPVQFQHGRWREKKGNTGKDKEIMGKRRRWKGPRGQNGPAKGGGV